MGRGPCVNCDSTVFHMRGAAPPVLEGDTTAAGPNDEAAVVQFSLSVPAV